MHELYHGALHKIYDNLFQNISSVHSYKTRFAKMQIVIFFFFFLTVAFHIFLMVAYE